MTQDPSKQRSKPPAPKLRPPKPPATTSAEPTTLLSPDAGVEPAEGAPARIPRADEFYGYPTPDGVVEALTEAGTCPAEIKRIHYGGDVEYQMLCPWPAEHRIGQSLKAVYVLPDGANPFGKFRCACERDVMELMEHVGILDQLRSRRAIWATHAVQEEAAESPIRDRSEPDVQPFAIAPAIDTAPEPLTGATKEMGESGGLSRPAPLAPPAAPDCEPVSAPPAGERGEMGVPPSAPVSPVAPVPNPTSAPESVSSPLEQDEIASHVFKPAPQENAVVAALRVAGLYRRPLGDRTHAFTCIRAGEHGDAESVGATYREPTPTHPYGRCSCGHAHTPEVDVHTLIDELEVSPFEASGKARIRLHPGETNLVVTAAELVLSKGPFFHARGRLTRLARDWQQRISVERPNVHTISAELATSIYWERKLEKGWVPTDPPPQVVQALLHSQRRIYLRPLDGVARQPILRPDGSLCTKPGYDPGTRIYADFSREAYPFGVPSEDSARSSLAYLVTLLAGYEFASEADRSAFLSALLTAAVRPGLAQAPAYLLTAPSMGSGKSHGATLISLFATGEPPHAVSYPASAEEATKLIPSLLMTNPAVILFDDTQDDWPAHGAINKALTSPTVTERELGINGLITVPTNALFLGTGNNIEPKGDLRRRVVSIRLEPADENPALRRFDFDPVREVARNRPRAVMAALEIIRAYGAEGCPAIDAPAIGGFGDWSRWCRAPLMWLGLPDPATSLIGQVRDDSDRQARKWLLTLLYEQFRSSPTQVQEMLQAAENDPELRHAIADLQLLNGKEPAKKLGQYLKHRCRRPVDGWRAEECDAPRWRRAWRVLGPDETGERGERPLRPFPADDIEPRPRRKAHAG